jgi:hypothetical protein
MTAPVIHGDVTPIFLQPTTDANDPAQICYGAADYRLLISTIFPSPGVMSLNDWPITSNSSAIVNVGAGTAVVAGTSAAEQRSYLARNPNVKTIQPPGPPTSSNRYDALYLVVNDGQVLGNHLFEWQVQCLSGSEAASPTVPAAPKDSIPLAAMIRRPGAVNILPADITDLRKVALLPSQPQSQKYWKTESSSSSAVFKTTEAKDTTVPNLQFTVLDATAIYRIYFTGIAYCSIAALILARIRDGGTAAPVVASTLLLQGNTNVGASTAGQSTMVMFRDLTFAVGVHTLGVFGAVYSGAGSGQLLGSTASRKQLTAQIVG